MLLSLTKRFIFVATVKTASTSIEQALKPHADICISDSQFGKHMAIGQLERHFAWLFQDRPILDYFVFGVLRDPVDYTVSLYNAHKHPDFASRPTLATADLNFDDFLDYWAERNADQMGPQHHRFLDCQGRIGANYIISYDRLDRGLKLVADRVGLPPWRAFPALNKSVGTLSARHLTPAQRHRILDRFAADALFMDRYCNRLIDRPALA